MKTIGLPALSGTYDNYIWVKHTQSQAWVVDPGESAQVIQYLEANQLELVAILITHEHFDHVDGIAALKKAYPNTTIYGPSLARCKHIDTRVDEKDTLSFPIKDANKTLTFRILDVPGHTRDHIAYLNDDELFCGDLLFTGGCGRVLGGSYAQFSDSLNKINQLPDSLKVYTGHEYTLSNLAFAQWAEPNNTDITRRIKAFSVNYPSIHEGAQSTLGLEKQTNPFLRISTIDLQNTLVKMGANKQDATQLFTVLRDWKDQIDENGYPQNNQDTL